MNSIHTTLSRRLALYRLWHRNPLSHAVHWTLFIAVGLIMSGGLLADIDHAYASNSVSITTDGCGYGTLTHMVYGGLDYADPTEQYCAYFNWALDASGNNVALAPGATSISYAVNGSDVDITMTLHNTSGTDIAQSNWWLSDFSAPHGITDTPLPTAGDNDYPNIFQMDTPDASIFLDGISVNCYAQVTTCIMDGSGGAVPAGQTVSVTAIVRFEPLGTTLVQALPDVISSWVQQYPASITSSWTDRRPIGTWFLAPGTPCPIVNGCSQDWSKNPNGWFNSSQDAPYNPGLNIDVTTASGSAAFAQDILSAADTNLQELQAANAQGIIIWDLEGEKWPQCTTYIGDPRLAETFAPEWDTQVSYDGSSSMDLIDAMFRKFTDAGYKVGVTIRPDQVTIPTATSSTYGGCGGGGPNEFGGWYGFRPNQDYVSDRAARIALLEAKMEYAYQRWGVTMFYIDSTDWVNDGQDLIQIHQDHPNFLLMPENTTLLEYSVGLPFTYTSKYGGIAGPGIIPKIGSFYPYASGALNSNGNELTDHFWELVNAIRQGSLILFDSWFANGGITYINQIYTDAALPLTAPAVSSSAATSIGTSSAILNGAVSSTGNGIIYVRGFEYGTTTSYGTIIATSSGPYDDSIDNTDANYSYALTGLACSTAYHYRSWAQNFTGSAGGSTQITASSSDQTFTTFSCSSNNAPNISSISVSGLTGHAATITWTTDDGASTEVEYGTTASYGSTSSFDSNLVTSHSTPLSGLQPNTTYHYAVVSTNGSNKTSTSADQTFTTGIVGAVVQHKNCTAASCSFDSPVTAGETIIVAGTAPQPTNASTSISISDSRSNQYVPADLILGNFWNGEIFYASNVSGGSDTVTESYGVGTSPDPAMAITEVSGLATTSPVDASTSQVYFQYTSSENPSTNSFTTSHTDFIYAVEGNVGGDGTTAAGGGYTLLGQDPGDFDAEEYASDQAVGTLAASFNNTSFGSFAGLGAVAFIQAGSSNGNRTMAPTQPLSVSAAAGNGQATVSFSPPSSNGGALVTLYTVGSNPGGIVATGASSPIVVSGLSDGTQYAFTVTATNGVGTSASSSASNAVTPAAPPTVTTGAATSITETTAVLNGTITADGGLDASSYGFRYGLDASYGSGTSTSFGSFGVGSFTQALTALNCGTTYHYEAYASGAAGTGVGSDGTFSTAACSIQDTTAPTVISFTMPSTSSSLAVAISSFMARDNVGVTGYLLTQSAAAPSASDPGWSGTVPTSFTFSSQGTETLYAWAKDAAGNVSSALSASVAISLPSTGGGGGSGTIYNGSGGGSSSVSTTPAVTAASVVPPAAVTAPSGTIIPTVYLNLPPGSTSSAVYTLQEFLVRDGYLSQSLVTGYYGPLTAAAVAKYRAAQTAALAAGGIDKELYFGLNDTEVAILQKDLNAAGYKVAAAGAGSPGHESTYFGQATLAAIERFQCAMLGICSGLPQTTGYGGTGAKTRALLNGSGASSAPAPATALTTPAATPTLPATTASAASPSSFAPFTATLKIEDRGADVKELQEFLNAHGFVIATSGNGSPGNESTYYGEATAEAVSKFQEFYASKILAPYGLASGTGAFGQASLKQANALIAAGQ